MTRSEVIDRHRLLQKKTPRYTRNFTQGMKSIQVEEKEETVKTKTSLSLLYRSFLDDDEVNSRRKDRTKSCFIHHLFPLFRNRCLFGLNMKMMKMTKTRDYKRRVYRSSSSVVDAYIMCLQMYKYQESCANELL